jgi:DNA-directed RNA polymerase subunit RPC12/RpoP
MTSHFPTPDRRPTAQVNIKKLIDDVQCSQRVRALRWPDGIACASCQCKHVIKRGFDDTAPTHQGYECDDCDKRFDDVTDTMSAGHPQPLKGGSGVTISWDSICRMSKWHTHWRSMAVLCRR